MFRFAFIELKCLESHTVSELKRLESHTVSQLKLVSVEIHCVSECGD